MIRYGAKANSFNPARDLFFREQVDSKLGLLGMLNYSAASRDRLDQVQGRSPATLRYRSELLTNVKAVIIAGDPAAIDKVMVTVGGVISSINENRYGIITVEETRELQIHLSGLYTLIELRGGWRAVADRAPPVLQWFLYWLDVSNHGFFSSKLTKFDMESNVADRSETYPLDDAAALEFVDFWSTLYVAVEAQHRNSPLQQGSLHKKNNALQLFLTLFEAGSPVQQYLSERRSFLVLHRIVPIMYANILFLLTHKDNSGLMDETLLAIYRDASLAKSDMVSSNELLFWTLETDRVSLRVRHQQSVEVLGRLLHTQSLWPLYLREELADALLDVLKCASNCQAVHTIWRPKLFHQIMSQIVAHNHSATSIG